MRLFKGLVGSNGPGGGPVTTTHELRGFCRSVVRRGGVARGKYFLMLYDPLSA